jgi:hypothetical protein
MARNTGRHHVSRGAKLTAGITGVLLVAGLAVAFTTRDSGTAQADGADKSLFVDITKVQPNVKQARQRGGASKGTFTVNCGKNENEHFNPDNFIAQPGVKNGAEHLHDYVGNLDTEADTTNDRLAKADTTCKNGDKSAYYWPVVRIDTDDETADGGVQPPAPGKPAASAVACPDVASLISDVPDQAQAEVERNLALLDTQVDEANKRVEAEKGNQDPNFVDNDVLGPLKAKRVATIDRIQIAIGRVKGQPQQQRQADSPAAEGEEGDAARQEREMAQDKQVQQDLSGLAACELTRVGDANGNGDQTDDGQQDPARKNPPKGADDRNQLAGNDGDVQRPVSVDLTFRGNPISDVKAMPRFLRVLTGDAKVSTNGTKNARASWSCAGFEQKTVINKYPICPEGSKVMRIHDFPSCWDGKNIDSKNHRDHIVFPNANGSCAKGFKPVPQLRVTLAYDIPRAIQKAGQYKVDSFPQEDHNPATDHDDFANVMSQQIMNRVVRCINGDRTCKE